MTSSSISEVQQMMTQTLYISNSAKALGIQLIREFDIRKNYGFSLFLNMYSHCDDQQSTLLWVHQHLEEFKNHDYQDVRSYFLECFPENAFF